MNKVYEICIFPQLALRDPETGVLTGKLFPLKFCDVENVKDFLVLRQDYDVALQRKWEPGDPFRSIIGNNWREGQLVAREPYKPPRESEFNSCRIR